MSKKVVLEDANNEKIYPQTTNTQIIKEDGTSFDPQEKLVAGEGISINPNTNVISANLTMNGNAPINGNFVVPTASTVIDYIDEDNTNAITSGAIYRLLGGSSLPLPRVIQYTLRGSATASQSINNFISSILAQPNQTIFKIVEQNNLVTNEVFLKSSTTISPGSPATTTYSCVRIDGTEITTITGITNSLTVYTIQAVTENGVL